MRAKVIGGVKYASPSPPASSSTSARPATGILSPKPSPDSAMHDAPSPWWIRGSCKEWIVWSLVLRPPTNTLGCGYM
ncbi:hypothetical protein LIER_34722 [Lithospermum erythrorhizon]|uniref:Uncharacterized protein n=1 Tax=Lithospermum erythrorhizon TaxID=34254 RepID=A0AAV3S134_LITER